MLFSSIRTAEHCVAGVPAAARMARAVAEAGAARCTIAVPGGWAPSPDLRAEVARLAPGLAVAYAAEADALRGGEGLALSGERLPDAAALAAAAVPLAAADPAQLRDGGGIAALDAAARRIVAATGKPGDGLVSRHFNRPISQAFSRILLRWPAIRPAHATWGTALLAAAMMLFLLRGDNTGLVVGALLFQAASIFDGVDGEIARATFRASPQGARLDSLIDAATNIACIGGVAANLAMQGRHASAAAGLAGMVMVAFGMAVIGWRGNSGPGLTFNAVKDHFAARRSRVMTWLTWLTMRDFYAAAGAVLIAAGLAGVAMVALAVVAAGWLVVVLAVMLRKSA